jgi:hypothetical protein
MNYKNLTENKIEDGEILSAEDEKIRSLLGSMKRVGAPKDFDFRLKARFANAKPNSYQPQFLPVLRYILPLSLVVVISAAVIFNSVYFADTRDGSMVAETHIPSSIKENNLPDKPAATEQINAADFPQPSVDIESASRNKISTKMPNAAAPMTVARSVKKPKPEILSRVNTSEVTGGSRTSASTSTRVITPPGIPINQALRTSPNSVNVKSLTAKDVLLQHGIEAVFENEGWKVKSVMQNSPAARSGIKVGDSIEAFAGAALHFTSESGCCNFRRSHF